LAPEGVSIVMISYSSWNGIKMHPNHHLITGFPKWQTQLQGGNLSD
jgi:beta-glucosidase